jgi:hypothetical protein
MGRKSKTGLTVPLREYFELQRKSDKEFQEERDRRYAEVNVEKEKALKIKETADLAALDLAREIQKYKDEKANELRSQIERERVTYATQGDLSAAVEKIEAVIAPIVKYVSAQQVRGAGLNAGWLYLLGALAALGTLVSIFLAVTRKG